MQPSIALIIENLIFSPLVFAVFVLLAVVWPVRRNRREKNPRIKWLVSICLVLIVLTNTWFFQLFSWPLKFLTPASEKHKADVIVVATAGVHESGAPSSGSTIRAYTAAQLYLEGWAPLILVTGGITKPSAEHFDAKGMHIILRGMGIPDKDILVENQSVDTYMNSTKSAEILNSQQLKKILLVTHDYHMLRLYLTFQHLGFEIYPYAASSFSKKEDTWWRYFDWRNFSKLQTYAHEYIGLLTYKIRGWI
ncbi:MAG: YdcF family protein [SAR324 cluster bacterium]|nr:YdcF family protein [SAR324 cluster bacterium]